MDGTMNIGRPALAGVVLEQKAARFKADAPHSSPAEAGRRMEALFATMLVKELRKTLPNEGFFGSGPGADTFNGMLDEQIGEQLARRGALDIAGQVKVALMRAQQSTVPDPAMQRPPGTQEGGV